MPNRTTPKVSIKRFSLRVERGKRNKISYPSSLGIRDRNLNLVPLTTLIHLKALRFSFVFRFKGVNSTRYFFQLEKEEPCTKVENEELFLLLWRCPAATFPYFVEMGLGPRIPFFNLSLLEKIGSENLFHLSQSPFFPYPVFCLDGRFRFSVHLSE